MIMPSARYQFSIKRALIATTFAAIACGMTARLILGASQRSLSREQGWLLLLGAVMAACIAFGVLVRKSPVAAIVGAVVVFLMWAIAEQAFWY